MGNELNRNKGERKHINRLVGLRRNGITGLIVGGVIASVAYILRVGEVVGPSLDYRGDPILFGLLATVLAFCVAVLVTIILCFLTLLKNVERE
jgi:hypothetical protein